MRDSNNNSISNCDLFSNRFAGFYSNRLLFTTFRGNRIANSTYGLHLITSSYLTLRNNTLFKCGYSFGGFNIIYWNTHDLDISNLVNGKPCYYFKNHSDITVPEGAGQIILGNCTNMTIRDQSISNASVPIMIGYSLTIQIENNTIENNFRSITTHESRFVTIVDNTCSRSTHYSLSLYYSDYLYVFNNSISTGLVGIAMYDTDSSYIENNSIYDNEIGIDLPQSNDNKIKNNTITGNAIGIDADNSNYNVIHYNSIFENSDYGILGHDSSNIASFNWWGHDSGPYHSQRNRDGKGDRVYDYLLFEPWLTHEYFSVRVQ